MKDYFTITATIHNLYTGALTKKDYFDEEDCKRWKVHMTRNEDDTYELTLTASKIQVHPEYIEIDGDYICNIGKVDYRSIEIH